MAKISSKEREKQFTEFAKQEIKEKPNVSANLIIENAQNKGIGIQRKKALKIIRQIKHKRKKPHSEKYIPNKYKNKKRRIIADYYPYYFGRIKVEYFDNYGEYGERWMTTRISNSKQDVYREMYMYEKLSLQKYHEDAQVIYEFLYGMNGLDKKSQKPILINSNRIKVNER
ncbi:MAG: hypothetical protein QXF80_07140 [Thermoplasmatales archaeon]